MTSRDCRRQRIGEYIDGELSGADRLAVARHLETCADCRDAAESTRRVGDLLREAAVRDVPALDGLASGVISRSVAERALSVRAVLARAVEDWHWFLVGFGSVTAGFVSVAFVVAVLQFGPAPQRDDSVSALLSNHDWRVRNSGANGSVYVWATQASGTDGRLVLTATDRAEAAAEATEVLPPELAGLTSEQDLIGALSETFERNNRPIDLASMDPRTRRSAEVLLGQILKLDRINSQRTGDGSATGPVYRVQFVTNTEVSAKGT